MLSPGEFATFTACHPDRAGLCLSPRHRAELFINHPHQLIRHPVFATSVLALRLAEVEAANGWTTRCSEGTPERVFAATSPRMDRHF